MSAKAAVVATALALMAGASTAAEPRTIKMATTTSTENSGLLACLLPQFTKATGVDIHVIAVGSGAALKLGENGDVDVVLSHSPAAEREFVAKGYTRERREVMYNDFVVVGPKSDPAKIAGQTNAVTAFKRIADAVLSVVGVPLLKVTVYLDWGLSSYVKRLPGLIFVLTQGRDLRTDRCRAIFGYYFLIYQRLNQYVDGINRRQRPCRCRQDEQHCQQAHY